MAKLPITPITDDVNFNQTQPTEPTLSESDFKIGLDSNAQKLKDYINNILNDLLNSSDTVDQSGSFRIGHSSANITADNAGDAIEELYNAIVDIVLGQIPDNSLTNSKLATDIKVGSLATLTTTIKDSVTNAINEIVGDVSNIQDYNNRLLEAVVTGSNGDITAPGITFTDGDKYEVQFDTAIAAPATISWNGGPTYALKDLEGNDIAIELNTIYVIVFKDDVTDFFAVAPRGAGGSWIKSIQHGSITINAVTETIALGTTLEDYNYAIVLLSYSGVINLDYGFDEHRYKAVPISNSQIQITKYADNGNDSICHYTVIEVDPNQVNQFIFDETTYVVPTTGSTAIDITIPSVDTSKTLIFGNFRYNENNLISEADLDWRYQLLNATTLRWNCKTGILGQTLNGVLWAIELK